MSKPYKRLEELDSAAVAELLQRWDMDEFVEFCVEKQLDGRKLLNVTEGLVKLWRPKINANKLIIFIEDLKFNPKKYLDEPKGPDEVVLRNEQEPTELKTNEEKVMNNNKIKTIEKETIIAESKNQTHFTEEQIKIIENSCNDVESQYQTVKKIKENPNQINFNNVEELIKKIVPAKSFLYRHQAKKEATPSYLPMDGSPKRRKIFRISGYEYPIFDWKRFSKPDTVSSDRGYYPMKRNSRFFITKPKLPESKPKYKSISTTEELNIYPEDHFYEDLCYTDIDKPRDSISSTHSVKPYRVKFQELFQSFRIPFFKKTEDIRDDVKKDLGDVEKGFRDVKKDLEVNKESSGEEKRVVVEKEHVYENNDSLSNMYDSVQAPVPVGDCRTNEKPKLPVEEYLEPVQLNKDYCDVNYKQKDESILGYIMSIFENMSGFWKETNEGTHTDSETESHKTIEVETKKWSEDKPRTSMIDRPLPVPVESEPYYMAIERCEAENLLKGQPNGTFLLRPSSQSNHAFTLSVACNDSVHNIGVRRRPDGRISLGFARRGERSFPDVPSLLRHHKKRRLLLVANGEVIGATTLTDSPQYYQTPCNIPVIVN